MMHPAKLFAVMTLFAIPFGMGAQNGPESFDEFRRSILGNYDKYRSELLSQYGKYLDSLWVEYPQNAGVERNPVPKPKDIPVAEDASPKPSDGVPPAPEETPDAGDAPISPSRPQHKNGIDLPFYGIRLSMPDVEYAIPNNLSRGRVSALWEYMYSGDYQEPIIKEIRRLADELNLNDYLVFELTQCYVDTKFSGYTSFSRYALKHFLLSNMGYDVRLAETGSGVPMILLPFKQMVYGRSFLNIGGRDYFAFSDAPFNLSEPIYTCPLPSDLDLGDSFDLKLKELKLPYKPYRYEIGYGDITLTGEVNANIYPILYRYPQMPIGDYAQSVVDSDMRRSVVSQLIRVLGNDSQKDQAERLLRFTQSAFDYATDGDNHGFEKPYFFEEVVYYPKCDCEDRAVFYSYLLYHVAGIENHIISYPGHEAVSLTLPSEELKGTSYDYEGKVFFISDPTFIGASIGMCMPGFETVKPTIDYICK